MESFFRKEDKRGILMHTSIEFIVAAIVIVLLISLGVQLYGIAIKGSEKEIAQSNLDKIIEEGTTGLEEDETRTVVVEGPNEWTITEFEEKLCFCKSQMREGASVYYLSDCESERVCNNLEKDFRIASKGGEIYLKNVIDLIFFIREGRIIISPEGGIRPDSERYVVLNNLLNYKTSESSESFENLLKAHINGEVSEEQITNILEDFSEKEDLGKFVFYVQNSDGKKVFSEFSNFPGKMGNRVEKVINIESSKYIISFNY